MPRGGKREGAGRKAGSSDLFKKEAAAAVAASGVTPLEYMLGIMRDGSADPDKRFEAAKASAPYCHPKLSNVTMDAKVQHELSREEIEARLAAYGVKI
jgi:hypothetical protein